MKDVGILHPFKLENRVASGKGSPSFGESSPLPGGFTPRKIRNVFYVREKGGRGKTAGPRYSPDSKPQRTVTPNFQKCGVEKRKGPTKRTRPSGSATDAHSFSRPLKTSLEVEVDESREKTGGKDSQPPLQFIQGNTKVHERKKHLKCPDVSKRTIVAV